MSLAEKKGDMMARMLGCLMALNSVYEMDEMTAVMTDCLSAESSVAMMDEMKAGTMECWLALSSVQMMDKVNVMVRMMDYMKADLSVRMMGCL